MVDEPRLLKVVSDFAQTLVSDYAIADALHDLVERVTELLDLKGAGVLLDDDGRVKFATAINEVVAGVERVQERAQAGPCVEAHRSGQVVPVTDLRQDPGRWPAFTEASLQAGIFAVVGIPMQVNGTRLGALNLYAEGPRAWSEDELAVAALLADMATAYVTNASALEKARRTAEQLQEALDSRVVIEQAKGMLAVERGISVDEAFERLRAHARRHRASLRSVAEAVVRLGMRP